MRVGRGLMEFLSFMKEVGNWSAELPALTASVIPYISEAPDTVIMLALAMQLATYCLSSLRGWISGDTPIPNAGNISIVLQQISQKEFNLVRDVTGPRRTAIIVYSYIVMTATGQRAIQGDLFKTTALRLRSFRDTEILVNSLRLRECLGFQARNSLRAELNALSLRAHEAGLRDQRMFGGAAKRAQSTEQPRNPGDTETESRFRRWLLRTRGQRGTVINVILGPAA
jgi:hypothetical protein